MNASKSDWTEMKVQITRFGYGWGFRGSSIEFATVILLLNAFVCVHLLTTIWGG